MEGVDGWIDGLDFPAKKLDLIDAAETAEAPQEELERLQRLGREQYDSRDEVEAELERES
jgi:Protein of unknown function (DUF2795)